MDWPAIPFFDGIARQLRSPVSARVSMPSCSAAFVKRRIHGIIQRFINMETNTMILW